MPPRRDGQMWNTLLHKNLFNSAEIFLKESNFPFFLSDFANKPLDFLNRIQQLFIYQLSVTWARHLDERGHTLFRACCDRWLDILNHLKKMKLIPHYCNERADSLIKWLSKASISIGNNVCFLADSTHRACHTKNHSRGLNICENFNSCGFMSKCHVTIETHRCEVSYDQFHRLKVVPHMSRTEKMLYIRNLVKKSSRLSVFRGAFEDRRRNQRPVAQIQQAAIDLSDEDSSNDIEVLDAPQAAHELSDDDIEEVEPPQDANELSDDDIEVVFPTQAQAANVEILNPPIHAVNDNQRKYLFIIYFFIYCFIFFQKTLKHQNKQVMLQKETMSTGLNL